MAGIIVIVVILACAVYQYFNGSLIKSFAMVIAALCASIAAFGFFEPLADLLIARESLVLWAQPLCFTLLFVGFSNPDKIFMIRSNKCFFLFTRGIFIVYPDFLNCQG